MKPEGPFIMHYYLPHCHRFVGVRASSIIQQLYAFMSDYEQLAHFSALAQTRWFGRGVMNNSISIYQSTNIMI